MEPYEPDVDANQRLSAEPVAFARNYQLEALDKAIKKNTIVFLETGSGKTLIAIMLLRSYAYLLRKPSPFIAVFLVPTVVLVTQQAEAVKMHTDLKVGKYWGEMGVDFWDGVTWKQQQDEHEVLVMTPAILLDALRHSFLNLEMIKVLIFDECHNARGRHPYACIMMEFYHRLLQSGNSQLPRIFGMTASPVKAKGSSSSDVYWKHISELENLMNSKVYTCASESVLAEYIPFSNTKLKFYGHVDIPYNVSVCLENDLKSLRMKHNLSLEKLCLSVSTLQSARKRLWKLHSVFVFCYRELGLWLAMKAAESLSCEETDIFSWGKLDACGERVAKYFCLDALEVFSRCISSEGPSIGDDMEADENAGYLTPKVTCLIKSLLEYRYLKDLRCIVFVERVVTAIALQTLLREVLPKLTGWKTQYMAGNRSGLQAQSRNKQNEIVEEFREGNLNIIIATSILEEGLDVQSCNLVIRFDPSATVCSFIQSRGRARMQNSDFLLMVKRGDISTLARVNKYISSGDAMREESLRHASSSCGPLDSEIYNEAFYQVESTGAVVTLSSSVALIYFYCSRLPSDGYFKPTPRCEIDKMQQVCTIYFPKSCPLQPVSVEGNIKTLKKLACLEACKQLHQIGALTDNLVPDIVMEEADDSELGREPYVDEQWRYVPPELVSQSTDDSAKLYHCYFIELQQNFECDTKLNGIMLAVRTKLEFVDGTMTFDLDVDTNLSVCMKYVRDVALTLKQVHLCQRFQITVFRVLLDHKLDRLNEALRTFQTDRLAFDYLLLPSISSEQGTPIIDWKCISSVQCADLNHQKSNINCTFSSDCRNFVHTKNDLVCRCMIENSLVYTPHNGHVYCIAGTFDDLDGNSVMRASRSGEDVTYKKYFKTRHGIDLNFERQLLLNGNQVFTVRNYLLRHKQKEIEARNASVELPPELCFIIMTPISVATLYSFSFLPSIMHRIESLLIADNLKKMHLDHCMQNVNIPTMKVLEAITTKKCQEKFHLESLETLGDSFLKYAVSQQLFKTYQSHHEGLLSVKKDKIISNVALCKRGCDLKLPGFIRNEPFDPKQWIIPGCYCVNYELDEELLSGTRKIYISGKRKLKGKAVADVVEALIGAFLSSGGEEAAMLFMNWLGIKVDCASIPYERNFPVLPEQHVNIDYFQEKLNYSFRDASFLVEALTHGSYMLPEIPRCYQRLEFIGDAVLDYLMTLHLYHKYPGISPGLLTDLRSASVNNDCYARSAVKAGIHKHILHASLDLQRHIVDTVMKFSELSQVDTFGWESETTFPKVLGDIIESLAGAIFVDSAYDKGIVFQSIIPLLEPLITPETVRFHPVRELNELCQKQHYVVKKHKYNEHDLSYYTIEVEANGITHKRSCHAVDKKLAKKLASKALVESLKKSCPVKISNL